MSDGSVGFFPSSDKNYAEHRRNDSERAIRRQALTRKQRQNYGQRGITGGNGADERKLANFERAIESEHRKSIYGASENSPGPGLPSGAIEQMSPIAREK